MLDFACWKFVVAHLHTFPHQLACKRFSSNIQVLLATLKFFFTLNRSAGTCSHWELLDLRQSHLAAITFLCTLSQSCGIHGLTSIIHFVWHRTTISSWISVCQPHRLWEAQQFKCSSIGGQKVHYPPVAIHRTRGFLPVCTVEQICLLWFHAVKVSLWQKWNQHYFSILTICLTFLFSGVPNPDTILLYETHARANTHTQIS